MSNKVYVIECDFKSSWNKTLTKRHALGAAIVGLAKKEKETVHFHDYKDPVAGAPVILLECSEAFLEEVKKLPGCKKTYDLWLNVATQRDAKVQKHYETALRPARPKFGP